VVVRPIPVGSSLIAVPCAMTIVVRPILAENLTPFADLVAGHPLFARYALTPARLAAALDDAHRQGDLLLGASQGGAAVGLAWCVPRGAFGRPYLRLLVVAAGATGAGIGTALIDEVERCAFAVAPDLYALVNEANRAAQAFYEARGFAVVGTLPGFAAVDLHEIMLRKRRPTAPAHQV
jgi:ribosomal protein S18 acetylase RimI-like enzyme